MGYLNNLLAKFTALNVVSIVEDVIVGTEENLADIQRAQMEHGLNSEGAYIGEYKQRAYAEYKFGRNPVADGHVDLRLTGSFYEGIYAYVNGDDLIIESSDDKSPELEAKYKKNGDIFGLDEDFKQQYLENYARPEFENEIQSATGLRFGYTP